ncbi:4Fe-4S binding protein [Haloplanus litoreus]|uniref:4Fe-4S binding protein n=2 Tax=Haloplanus litoreus TaxID=767515 RepID=A0ABD5ZXL1_9EURY
MPKWGRGVFCGWICPFGALSELLYKVTPWAYELPASTTSNSRKSGIHSSSPSSSASSSRRISEPRWRRSSRSRRPSTVRWYPTRSTSPGRLYSSSRVRSCSGRTAGTSAHSAPA